MIITKDTWIRFIYAIAISTAIYLISALAIAKEAFVTLTLLKSILLGVGICFISEMLFVLAQKIWPRSNIPGYFVLILVIAAGTSIGSYLLGTRSFILIAAICLAAEVCGVLIVFLYLRHYSRVLNEKLKIYKDESH